MKKRRSKEARGGARRPRAEAARTRGGLSALFTDEGKTNSDPAPGTSGETVKRTAKRTAMGNAGTRTCCKIQYHHGIRGRRKWRRRREAQVFSPGKAKEETKTPLKTGGTETPIHERSHPLLPVLCPDIHCRYYQLCAALLSTGSHGFGSWWRYYGRGAQE